MKIEDLIQEMDIQDIDGFLIGQAEDAERATGVSVFLAPEGAASGVDVRGGGPASRETELLNPRADAQVIHAVVLSGGSAFGLNAAGGVMKSLREREIGFETGYAKVPLVCQSCLFDLGLVDSYAYPDEEMAAKAVENAFEGEKIRHGNYGAGCGATVGKIMGAERCMKSGIGFYAVQLGDLQVGAAVAVNALGDIYDPQTGEKLAGLLGEDLKSFEDSMAALLAAQNAAVWGENHENTTLGVILTNARLDKSQMGKVAAMAQNAYARVIKPVHTTADGDTIYAMASGQVESHVNIVGTLACYVMERAIRDAVLSAEDAYGLNCANSQRKF